MWSHLAIPSFSIPTALEKLTGAGFESYDEEICQPDSPGALVLFGLLAGVLPARRRPLLACAHSEGKL